MSHCIDNILDKVSTFIKIVAYKAMPVPTQAIDVVGIDGVGESSENRLGFVAVADITWCVYDNIYCC